MMKQELHAMTVDFHVHITPADIINNWRKYEEKEPHFSMISRSKVNKFAAAEDVIAMMSAKEGQEGFDKAVIFGFAFRDIGLCRYVNDYVIETIKQFPDKLIGFAVVPPGGKETAVEIERCHDAGLKGVGELFPAGQSIDLEDKKRTETITDICKERNIPLLLHANESVGHQYVGKTDMPLKQLETFVVNNPGLKIVFAHWGGGIFIYETMREIKEAFTNVYYDTSITPFLYDERIYRAANALDICDKILFGSDFPIISPYRCIETLNKSGIPDNEKQLILGGNACKLLNIVS